MEEKKYVLQTFNNGAEIKVTKETIEKQFNENGTSEFWKNFVENNNKEDVLKEENISE